MKTLWAVVVNVYDINENGDTSAMATVSGFASERHAQIAATRIEDGFRRNGAFLRTVCVQLEGEEGEEPP